MTYTPNKHWLPWLSEEDKSALYSTLSVSLAEKLQITHWGTQVRSTLQYLQPRFLVSDIRGVALITGALRYQLNRLGSRVFYRGQARHIRLLPSLFRVPRGRTEPLTALERKSALAWLSTVMDTIKPTFDPRGEDEQLREALAQHYGLRTTCLDILDHFQTAAWFAYDAGVQSSHDRDDGRHDDSVGYIFVLAVPSSADVNLCKVHDLRIKPSNWLRPHVQQAFSLRLCDPTAYGGEFEGFVLTQLIVSRSLLRLWSNYNVLARAHVYPGANQDDGQHYWDKSVEALKRSNIPLDPPHIQETSVSAEPIHLVGKVVELVGSPNLGGEIEGGIILHVLSGGKALKVRVHLGPVSYALAGHAHLQQRYVSVQGKLVRGPQMASMDNPTNFAILNPL